MGQAPLGRGGGGALGSRRSVHGEARDRGVGVVRLQARPVGPHGPLTASPLLSGPEASLEARDPQVPWEGREAQPPPGAGTADGAYLLAPTLCPIRNPQSTQPQLPDPVEGLPPGQQKEPQAPVAPLPPPPDWNRQTEAPLCHITTTVSTSPLDGPAGLRPQQI